MARNTTPKVAEARRTDGNLYDVTYPGRADLDVSVPYGYLHRLARQGWRVSVDQTHHRGEGEPATYEVDPAE